MKALGIIAELVLAAALAVVVAVPAYALIKYGTIDPCEAYARASWEKEMTEGIMAGENPVALALGAVVAESLMKAAGRTLATHMSPLECATGILDNHPLLSGYLGRGE